MTASHNKQGIQRIRTKLLSILNDAEFHSGEALAEQFSLSRSAISNHIKALCELGIEIFSVKGRGYKLATPIELLNSNEILATLPVTNHSLVKVENLVTSTNDILKQSINEAPSGLVCLAEAQSAGRGRRGRKWVSPFGSSLYFSMLWHFEHGYQTMSGLSLMVGVVLNQTLQDLGVKACELKWPNDLYYDGKKLAGILVEVEGQVGASATAIIGIGVNIKLPNNVKGIDQAFTDLAHINDVSVKRNQLASALIKNLWSALPNFESQGLAPFLDAWQTADLYVNKPVTLLMGERKVTGISRGIDKTGALLIESLNDINLSGKGKITAYHGGEISVRPI